MVTSNLDLAVFKPGSSQTNDFKIGVGIIRIGQGLVGSMSG